MEAEKKSQQQKKCLCCGRYFRPDNRVGDRQKYCKRGECQKRRRQVQQKKWHKANPDYFQGRYKYLKEWLKMNPGYLKGWRAKQSNDIQTQIPPASPIISIRLNTRENIDFGDIQTLVLTLVQSGQALWVTGARMHPV